MGGLKMRVRSQGLSGGHRQATSARQSRHYHLTENSVGDAPGYRDDLYTNRRLALEAARARAEWLAAIAGSRVETLLGPAGRYLVTSGRPRDAGRMILVDECDDAECLEVSYDSMLELGQ
jgi:hypothetical protein